MRLSKQSGYAVRIVLECAQNPDKLLRIAGIAERNHITRHNIAKTVPLLVHHNIIEAVRGRSGGIRLARPPEDITIGEIVRVTEHGHVAPEDFAASPADADMAAPLGGMLDDALDAFISVLDQHTVAEMIATRRSVRRGAPPPDGENDDDGSQVAGGEDEPVLGMVLKRPGPQER